MTLLADVGRIDGNDDAVGASLDKCFLVGARNRYVRLTGEKGYVPMRENESDVDCLESSRKKLTGL